MWPASKNGSSARSTPSTCAASAARTASASGSGGRTRAPATRTRSRRSACGCGAGCRSTASPSMSSRSLSHFSAIVPCGVVDPRYGVTSLVDLGLPVTMEDVDVALRRAFEDVFGATSCAPAGSNSLTPWSSSSGPSQISLSERGRDDDGQTFPFEDRWTNRCERQACNVDAGRCLIASVPVGRGMRAQAFECELRSRILGDRAQCAMLADTK